MRWACQDENIVHYARIAEEKSMLAADAVERAVLHLSSLGDTDIFPPPFEFVFYAEQSALVVDTVQSMDGAIYKPKSCFEALSPKNSLSFRIAHQLYPADTLLYTAAVIQIAPSIEALRLPISNGPFSYRFLDIANEPRLFADSSSFHDWLNHQKNNLVSGGTFDDVQHVLETDISDFYARIYFHRIEHVLDDCDAPNAVRKVIEGVIKFSRARQSHGLPVGTSASRLLAEGLLNDTDRMIVNRAISYTRYVDDFRIVIGNQSGIHTMATRLAEHLMLTEGLSLNSGKTRTYVSTEIPEVVDSRLSDIFNDDEMVSLSQYIRAVYDDEDVSVEDIEEVDPLALGIKLSEIVNRTSVDYTAVKVILKALRVVSYPDPIGFIGLFNELLYYTPRDFCIAIGAMAQRLPLFAEPIAVALVSLLEKSPYREMTLSRIWVNHLFVSQALPINNELIDRLPLTQSVIERRQAFLLRGLLKDRAFFREWKTRFDEASDWEKPALMYGASCLSRGEYSTWLDTIKDHYNDIFSSHYRKWLIANQSDLQSKLTASFLVKSRSEKLADLFLDEVDDLPPL